MKWCGLDVELFNVVLAHWLSTFFSYVAHLRFYAKKIMIINDYKNKQLQNIFKKQKDAELSAKQIIYSIAPK